ncbi:ATP-binding protein [Saccharomonospora azurea]|uniref:ATP-binding protein n=1 Tax=Saccharomonospora azurea TaxID=40988 RepID=UPI003333878C
MRDPSTLDEHEIAERRERMQAQIPSRFRKWVDPANLPDEVEQWCQNYAEGSPQSLLLAGTTGTRKTTIALSALLRAFELRPVVPRVIKAAQLYDELRDANQPGGAVDGYSRVLARYCQAPLLFVDDLGANRNKEFVEEVNYRLTDYRFENELPTIFTTNLGLPAMEETWGSRVYSRVLGMSDLVPFTGRDFRLDRYRRPA